MKTNTNRIRSNRNAARPSPQVKINHGTMPAVTRLHGQPRAEQTFAAPETATCRALCAVDAEDEFSLMHSEANAAATLLVLMAANAQSASRTNDGWSQLDFPGFDEGLLELSLGVIGEFQMRFDELHREVKELAAKLENPNLPMPEEPQFPGVEFEDAVCSLAHVLQLLGYVCSERRNVSHQIDHCAPMFFADKLQERFKSARLAWHQLRCAAQNQSAPLQAAR